MKFPKGISLTRKPGMADVRGRVWKKTTVTLPCGTKIEAHYEAKIGTYFYFKTDGDWRCGKMAEFAVRRGWYVAFDLKDCAA